MLRKIMSYLQIILILTLSVLIVRAWIKGFDMYTWLPAIFSVLILCYGVYKGHQDKSNN